MGSTAIIIHKSSAYSQQQTDKVFAEKSSSDEFFVRHPVAESPKTMRLFQETQLIVLPERQKVQKALDESLFSGENDEYFSRHPLASGQMTLR